MKRTKYFVCPKCGSIIQATESKEISCCSEILLPIKPQKADENHSLTIREMDGEFYVECAHEMTKEHYINFFAYVGYDRSLMIKLYPEQDSATRMPRAYSGKILYYCNKHGLFEYLLTPKRKI